MKGGPGPDSGFLPNLPDLECALANQGYEFRQTPLNSVMLTTYRTPNHTHNSAQEWYFSVLEYW